MVVGRDRWEGDVRHVEQISELRDVCVTAAPSYGDAARAEYRSEPEVNEPDQEAAPMPPESTPGGTAAPDTAPAPEDRAAPAGTLRVEDRAGPSRPARGLAAAFRDAGFPGETAVVDFGEFRAATFSGAVDTLSPVRVAGVDLGQDQRYAWPFFPQVSVEPDVGSA